MELGTVVAQNRFLRLRTEKKDGQALHVELVGT